MENRPLVVLLGDSVLIDGVAVSLGENEGATVIHLNAPSVDVHDRLGCLKPDLVVFELDSPYAPSIMSLLREQSGTTLMGLDLTCSRTIIVNSYQHTTHSMDELTLFIHAQAGQSARVQTGGPTETNTRQAEILVGTTI